MWCTYIAGTQRRPWNSYPCPFRCCSCVGDLAMTVDGGRLLLAIVAVLLPVCVKNIILLSCFKYLVIVFSVKQHCGGMD